MMMALVDQMNSKNLRISISTTSTLVKEEGKRIPHEEHNGERRPRLII